MPPTLAVSTLAGSGTHGHVDGQGYEACFFCPCGMAFEGDGHLLVADSGNHRIRRIAPDGRTTTVAGSGRDNFADGMGIEASFAFPYDVAVEAGGHILVTDWVNHRIRRIAPDGMVTTLAGAGKEGFADGHRTEALFYGPFGVAVQFDGNIVVTDSGNNRIRRISPDGKVTTLAGSGREGFADGTGTDASFSRPCGLAVEGDGNILVADTGNHRIRRISTDGLVTTLAGSGRNGFTDGHGMSACFAFPHYVASEGDGHVLVADSCNKHIRRITPDGWVSTLSLRAKRLADGHGTVASFKFPVGLAVDCNGDILVADRGTMRISKISSGFCPPHADLWRPGSYQNDMERMLQDTRFSDVEFVVNGERIQAHRCILAARSQYFATMFASSFREAQANAPVHVKDTSAAAFRSLVKYLYTDELTFNDADVVHLMQLAHRHDDMRMYRRCESHVRHKISVSNCVPWLLLAHEGGPETLRQLLLRSAARLLQSNMVQRHAAGTIQALRGFPGLMVEVLEHFPYVPGDVLNEGELLE